MKRAATQVLLLESNDEHAAAITGMLARSVTAEFGVVRTARTSEALTALDGQRFHIGLIGFETTGAQCAHTLKQFRQSAPDLPLIAVTDSDDETHSLSVLATGVSDYLTRPTLSVAALARSIHQAIERNRTETELQFARQREHRLASHDSLTGLPNRLLLLDRLAQAIALSERYEHTLAVMFIDLDGFKRVNDSLGHDAGDQLLCQVAQRLTMRLRDSDTVARLGGDEFVVLLNHLRRAKDAANVAENLLGVLATPYQIADQEVVAGASIGIALYPRDGEKPETLLKCADAAMYSAKRSGRGCYTFYTLGMSTSAITQLTVERKLREAVRKQEFVMHYQPQVDASDGQIFGVEALLRWPTEEGRLRLPVEFLAVTEETGLILELGEWILRTVCLQNLAWLKAGLRPIRVAVNLTPRQLRQRDLPTIVRRVLDETQLPPPLLELEIAENSILDNAEILSNLTALKDLGVRISLDDFGTGYSTLDSLRRVPTDALKIDRSFIRDLLTDSNTATITAAMIAMAQSMKLDTIAEGVEQVGQLEFLRAHRCHHIQGFYFSQAVPPAELPRMLAEGLRVPAGVGL